LVAGLRRATWRVSDFPTGINRGAIACGAATENRDPKCGRMPDPYTGCRGVGSGLSYQSRRRFCPRLVNTLA
jgi:hypothetical protein